ncbi:hypothetical protein [Jannaschia formosa]|uniref:hypothetical protein n=1 Tax=Jannaschia formosa TaxID=2259592 RepID=UPI0010751B0E|nr:hypothetical protein [Jannaschia formosa]TFL17891.1 hypothetical protein DR046_12045 [Jannaschia formosa]
MTEDTTFTDPRAAFDFAPFSDDWADATDGPDRLSISGETFASFQFLDGKGGDDVLISGSAMAIIYGGYGNDTLVAGPSVNDLYGEDGNDVLIGSRGEGAGDNGTADLYGGEGNDTLFGNDRYDGRAVMRGGPGDDVYHLFDSSMEARELSPSRGNDQILDEDGGHFARARSGGVDTVYVYDRMPIEGFIGIERIIAAEGMGNLFVMAEKAIDPLRFKYLGQELIGNEGNNLIVGWGGTDIMTGGGGRDRFGITAEPSHHNKAFITDFDDEDVLIFNDQMLGVGREDYDIRPMTRAQVDGWLASGKAEWTRETGEIRIDYDDDGQLEIVARLAPNTKLDYDDLFLA